MRKILLSFFPLLILLFFAKLSFAGNEVKVKTPLGSPTSQCTESTTEPVAFFLLNDGTTNLTGQFFNVSFSVNGGPAKTESFSFPGFTVGATVGGTFQTNFADLSLPGAYTIKVYTQYSSALADTATVTITNLTSVAGSLLTMNGTGEDSLCSGGTYNHLTLSGFTAPANPNIIRWESSSTGTWPWTNLFNAHNTTYSPTPLSDPTYYRVIVQNGICSADSSSIATLIVYPIPHLVSTYPAPPYTVYTGACSSHPFSITVSSTASNSTFDWKKVHTSGLPPPASDTAWASWTRISSDIGAHRGTGSTINNYFTASDSTDGRPNAYYRFIITAHGCKTPEPGDLLQIRLDSLAPVAAGVIAGATPVCMSTSNIYSVPAITHAAWYNWNYTGQNVNCTDAYPLSCFDNSNTYFFAPSVPGTPFPFANLATSGNMTVNGGNWCSAYYGNGATSSKAITVDTAALIHAGGPDFMCQVKPIVLSGAHVGGSVTTGTWSFFIGGGTLSLLTATSRPDTVHFTPTPGFVGTVTLRLTTATPGAPYASCGPQHEDRVITVNSPSSAHAGGPTTICQSHSITPPSIYLTGAGINPSSPPGTQVQWKVMTPGGSVNYTGDTTKPDSIQFTPVKDFAGIDTLRLITNNPDGGSPYFCIADTVYRYITIDSLAMAIAGGPDTVCQSAAPSPITLIGAYVKGGANQGKWQKVGGASGVLSNAGFHPNATIVTQTYTPLAGFVGIDTLRLISNDITGPSCHIDTSYRYIVVNLAATVYAGIDATICEGSTYTLSGATIGGSAVSQTWSTSGDGTFDNVNLLAATYTLGHNDTINGTVTLTITSNDPAGPCIAATDNMVITINPAATVYAGVDATICSGNNYILSGAIGGGASSSIWTTLGDGGFGGTAALLAATYTPGPIDITNGKVKLVITTDNPPGPCAAVTDTMILTINPPPIGGTIGNEAIVCSGSNSDTLTLTEYHFGTINHWESSIDGGAHWISIANIAPQQFYSNITNTTQYRVAVLGACGLTYSEVVQITVDSHPLSVGGTVSKNDTVCNGNNRDTLRLTGNTGKIIRWEYSSDHGNTWVYVNDTTSSLIYHNLTDTTIFHAVSLNSACGPANSSNDTVTVIPLVSVTNASIASICSGSGPGIVLTSTTPSTFAWTIGTITGGITGASASSGATINQTLTNPSNSVAGTVEYIVTPTPTTGLCVGSHYIITITVNPTPAITNAAIANTCSGSLSNIVLTSSAPSTFSWTIGAITGGITGASPSSGATINQTLINPSNSATGTVEYIVTPTSTISSCSGAPFTITVTVNPVPSLTNAPTATICGGTSISILLTSSAPSAFSWTIGAITGGITGANSGAGTAINQLLTNPSGSVAGTVDYIITPTATSGSCAGAPFTITITVNPAVATPVFTLGALSSRCQGAGTVTYAAPNNTVTTYTLSAAGTSSINPATGDVTWDATYNGTATITATATGCNGTLFATHTVIINPLTVGGILAGSTIVCSTLNNGTLTLSGEIGNIAAWQSSIDNGTTWNTIVPNNSTAVQAYAGLTDTTMYRVIVTSGSCGSDISTVGTITVDPPSIGGTVTPNVSLCAGPHSGTVTLNGQTGNILRWEYSTDGGSTWVYINNTTNNQTYSNPTMTTYYHAVVQNGVCAPVNSFNDTITVNPHSVAGSIGGVVPGCAFSNGGTLTLTGNVGTIHWQYSTNNGVSWTDSTGTAASLVYSNLHDTTWYRVIVQSGACASDTSSASKIIIYPKPNTVFNADTVCLGLATAFVNLSTVASTIQFYQWDFGDNSNSLAKNPTHTYAMPGIDTVKLITTSFFGCLDTAKHAVEVYPLPSALIAHGSLSFCCGDSVTLSANAGMNYVWIPAATPANSQSVKVTNCAAGGPYQVTVTNPSTTCSNSSTVNVVIFPHPIANAGKDTTIFLGNSVTLHGQGGTSYLWSPISGLNNSTNASPVASPISTTSYELTVTDANSCTAKDTVIVTVILDYNVIVTNLITANGDGFNDKWIVKNIENYPNTETIVVNREGQQVFYSSAYDNSWDGTYKGKALPDGTYYYFIKFNNSSKVFKGPITILNEKK